MLYDLLLAQMGESDELKMVAIGACVLIALISIISSAVHRTVSAREREMSRREIAAYVAEGSMTPDDAAKLLADSGGQGCGRKNRNKA